MNKNQPVRVWIFMVDSRNSADLRDLDHLDEILWGANPNARRGDLVLMYRTAPYSDIAYMFSALSDPRPARQSDAADMPYVIELGNKARLTQPLQLSQIRQSRRLSQWSFARYQQGAMRRTQDIRAEGFWPGLRHLLISRAPATAALPGVDGRVNDRGPAKPRKAKRQDRLRVYLSYASEDKDSVRVHYRRLKREQWLEVWFDQESLVTGDPWKEVIAKAVRTSDAMVIFLSSRSVSKIGFFQVEVKWALKIADEQPEGTTFILPAKLERCEVPDRLTRWQCVELFARGGRERLLAGLRKRTVFLDESRKAYRHVP